MTDTPKREPLLSDADIFEFINRQEDNDLESFKDVAGRVRYYYENLIDAGVLMVVKTVKRIPTKALKTAALIVMRGLATGPNFCPIAERV